MEIKTSKQIGEEYGRFLEEEELIEEGDNYNFTPYNSFMNKKWVSIYELIEFVECNCGDIDFIYQLKELLNHNPTIDGIKNNGGA